MLRIRFPLLLWLAFGWLCLGAAGVAAQAEDQAPEAEHAAGEEHAAGAGTAAANPLTGDPDLAIWTFVVFLVTLAFLWKFAWGPIVQGLEKREAGIASCIEDAQRSSEEAAERLRQYEAKLAAAGEEAREIVARGRQDAEGAKERIIGEAQQAAERQRERALEDIANARNAALQEITQRSVDLASVMAGRMLQRQLSPEDHSRLIRETLEQVPSSS